METIRPAVPSRPDGFVPHYPSARVRSLWVLGLLTITVVALAISIVSTFFHIGLLRGVKAGTGISISQVDASDTRQFSLAIAILILFLGTGIAWLLWQHRAHLSLRVSGLDFTPGWAVGWWFIPILSLWKPYQAMSELWRASTGAIDWKQSKVWQGLRWWWGAWLVSAAAAIALQFMPTTTLEHHLSLSYVVLADRALEVLAGIFAILIVRGIQARQAVVAAVQSPSEDAPQEQTGRLPRSAVIAASIFLVVTLGSSLVAYAVARGTSRTNERDETAPRTISALPGLPSQWTLHRDSGGEFELGLPSGWERVEDPDTDFAAQHSVGSSVDIVVAVVAEDLDPQVSLDSYADLVRNTLVSSFEQERLDIQDLRRSSLRMPAGDAVELRFVVAAEGAEDPTVTQSYIVLVHNGKGWGIIFSVEPSASESYERTMRDVLATFRFLD